MSRNFAQNHISSGIRDAKDMIRHTPEHIPPFLWGPPGIGKTDLVNQLAQEIGARVIVLKASELRPEDLAGVPFPYEEGWTQFHPLRQLLELTQGYPLLARARFAKLKANGDLPDGAEFEEPDQSKVVLFLDEFSNAQPDMVAPFQYLVLNRRIGGIEGHLLRDNVRIIAAGNREQDMAMTHDLTTPLKSRFMHIEVEPSLDEWIVWARENEVLSTIMAFVRQRESQFHDFDPKTKDRTYPCPRSWAMLSDALNGLDATDLSVERMRTLRRRQAEGLVGPGAAAEYIKFEDVAVAAPTAEDIIASPLDVSTFEEQPDIAMVAIENLISAVRRHPDRFVDSGLVYVARMHAEYQTIFHTAIMNLHGDMPKEVIERVFDSDHWETVRSNISRIDSVMRETERGPARSTGRLGIA